MPVTGFAGLAVGLGIPPGWDWGRWSPLENLYSIWGLPVCLCLQEVNGVYVRKGDLEANAHSLVEEISFLKSLYEEVSISREGVGHPPLSVPGQPVSRANRQRGLQA